MVGVHGVLRAGVEEGLSRVGALLEGHFGTGFYFLQVPSSKGDKKSSCVVDISSCSSYVRAVHFWLSWTKCVHILCA